MSQASTLKGPAITNLDATPVVDVTAGEGIGGELRHVGDWVTALTADTTSSTYRICRFPTQARIKRVVLNAAAVSAGAADIDIAFSDSTVDGTPPNLQGTVPQVSSADNKWFGAAHSLVAQANVDITYAGSHTMATANEPIWKALGYATDPGGYFDIFMKVTTAITTGGIISVTVEYVI